MRNSFRKDRTDCRKIESIDLEQGSHEAVPAHIASVLDGEPAKEAVSRNLFRRFFPLKPRRQAEGRIKDTRHPDWDNGPEEVRKAHMRQADEQIRQILESYKSAENQAEEVPRYVPRDEVVPVSKVIDYLLAVASEDPTRSITIANLPTFLYYCQGHYLASTGKPLFSDDLLTPEVKYNKRRTLQVEVVEKRYRRISEAVRKLTGKYPSLRPARKTETHEQKLRNREDTGVAVKGLSRLQRAAVAMVWRMYRDYSADYLRFVFKHEINDGGFYSSPGHRSHEWRRREFKSDTADLDWMRENFSPLYDFNGELLHKPEEA
jgi:uncharacterized phage-associated protein